MSAVPPLYTTVYVTKYSTKHLSITRYWTRLDDGTYVLLHTETTYLEESVPRRGRRTRPPSEWGEETTAVEVVA